MDHDRLISHTKTGSKLGDYGWFLYSNNFEFLNFKCRKVVALSLKEDGRERTLSYRVLDLVVLVVIFFFVEGQIMFEYFRHVCILLSRDCFVKFLY